MPSGLSPPSTTGTALIRRDSSTRAISATGVSVLTVTTGLVMMSFACIVISCSRCFRHAGKTRWNRFAPASRSGAGQCKSCWHVHPGTTLRTINSRRRCSGDSAMMAGTAPGPDDGEEKNL
jgi:hypothetical protein